MNSNARVIVSSHQKGKLVSSSPATDLSTLASEAEKVLIQVKSDMIIL
jgi:hypothetical protein